MKPSDFFNALRECGVAFYAGVPDSLLKDFCAYVSDNLEPHEHIITANEGSAVALAAGYHLATDRIPAVYMQNSGIGNSINPLMSLADPEVYSIPMLLIIGWRGQPGVHDEPQHVKQGRIMEALLKSLEIPFQILGAELTDAVEKTQKLIETSKREKRPVAILVKQGSFEEYKLSKKVTANTELTRERAIELVIDGLGDNATVVSTTGKASRELYECRVRKGQNTKRDFLTVGSMGHSSQIALGIALQKPDKQIICLDGDGAVLMHMGGLSNVGTQIARNYKHIVLNNGSHDSVGGQPTVGFQVNFPQIFTALGYKAAFRVSTEQELRDGISRLIASGGPAVMEVLVKPGARKDLGRPKTSPIENKSDFMRLLGN